MYFVVYLEVGSDSKCDEYFTDSKAEGEDTTATDEPSFLL